MAFLRRDRESHETSIIIADAADGQNQRSLISRKGPETFSSEGLSWSPDGKTIAFSAHKTNSQEEILAVNIADGRVTRIVGRDWGGVANLGWLPDGSGLIVLASEKVGERARQIWLVSHPSGEARQITNDLNIFLQSSLSISAGGKLAVLQGHYNVDMWIAPHGDYKQARRVLQGVAPRYEGVDGLAWTPDGRLLYTAYIGDSGVIWSINSDGSNLKQVTPGKPNCSDSNLSVTSDGRYVVFQSNRSGNVEIWRVNLDSSNLKQLTTGGNNSSPSLSPDGQWVIYTSVHDGEATLLRIPIEGGEPTRIADAFSSVFRVSPNGQYTAYFVQSTKRLLVTPFVGGEPVRTFSIPETALRARPLIRWTPDGQAILYKDDFQGIWRQALKEPKPQLVVGSEELQVRQLAWSLDGKNLAYTSGAASQEIILIENFK